MFILRVLASCMLLCAFAIAADPQDGLKVEVLYKPDNCDVMAVRGDKVHVMYTGRLAADKSVFDSNTGRSPLPFVLGAQRVIRGFDDGTMDMCINEKRRVTIPPHLGYGSHGHPPVIPRDATLIFDIELVKVEKAGEFQDSGFMMYAAIAAAIMGGLLIYGCLAVDAPGAPPKATPRKAKKIE